MKKFKDFPQFTPNISPKDVLKYGSFGGTYFRPIKSSITGKKYSSKQIIKEYPTHWFQGIDIDTMIISSKYDKKVNKYKVTCGSSLENWETSGWINKQDPYGWFQWYCRFYQGRRTNDDERQIKRWEKLAGPKGRFKRRLMNLLIKEKARYNDYTISPVIRQVLLHWGYELSSVDLNSYKRSLKK
jgi:hypothetical protein